MIAVLDLSGARGTVPGNPVIIDCLGQERQFVIGSGIEVLMEGIHLRSCAFFVFIACHVFHLHQLPFWLHLLVGA